MTRAKEAVLDVMEGALSGAAAGAVTGAVVAGGEAAGLEPDKGSGSSGGGQ